MTSFLIRIHIRIRISKYLESNRDSVPNFVKFNLFNCNIFNNVLLQWVIGSAWDCTSLPQRRVWLIDGVSAQSIFYNECFTVNSPCTTGWEPHCSCGTRQAREPQIQSPPLRALSQAFRRPLDAAASQAHRPPGGQGAQLPSLQQGFSLAEGCQEVSSFGKLESVLLSSEFVLWHWNSKWFLGAYQRQVKNALVTVPFLLNF